MRGRLLAVGATLWLAACSGGTGGSLTGTAPTARDGFSSTSLVPDESSDSGTTASTGSDDSPASSSDADSAVVDSAPSATDGAVVSSVEGTAVVTTVDLQLVDAVRSPLPAAGDLPAGWSMTDDPPIVGFEAGRGDFVGACGGANADRRALDSGGITVAHGATYESPKGFQGFVSVYVFADGGAASAFIDRTRAVGSCARAYSVREGSAPGEYDGFGDTSYDRVVRSDVEETTRSEMPDWGGTAAPADEAVVLFREDALSTTADGTAYSAVETSVTVFERHGRLVMAASLGSYCCTTGYRNAAGTAGVAWADLVAPLGQIRARTVAAAASLP